eukprot:2154101-Rhodomonas_salina.1
MSKAMLERVCSTCQTYSNTAQTSKRRPLTSRNAATKRGAYVLSHEPCPRRPYAPHPHVYSRPAAVTHAECAAPHATNSTPNPTKPPTSTASQPLRRSRSANSTRSLGLQRTRIAASERQGVYGIPGSMHGCISSLSLHRCIPHLHAHSSLCFSIFLSRSLPPPFTDQATISHSVQSAAHLSLRPALSGHAPSCPTHTRAGAAGPSTARKGSVRVRSMPQHSRTFARAGAATLHRRARPSASSCTLPRTCQLTVVRLAS